MLGAPPAGAVALGSAQRATELLPERGPRREPDAERMGVELVRMQIQAGERSRLAEAANDGAVRQHRPVGGAADGDGRSQRVADGDGNSHRVAPFVSESGCGALLCGSIRPRIRGESCWLAS